MKSGSMFPKRRVVACGLATAGMVVASTGYGVASSPPGRFQPNGSYVLDSVTGLTWRPTNTSVLVWSGVAAHCAALVDGGGGWRAPSIMELLTLVDTSRTAPAIDTDIFPNAKPTSFYWSGTTAQFPVGNAWGVNFESGEAGLVLLSSTNDFWCVR
jgi:hypothetical protein